MVHLAQCIYGYTKVIDQCLSYIGSLNRKMLMKLGSTYSYDTYSTNGYETYGAYCYGM